MSQEKWQNSLCCSYYQKPPSLMCDNFVFFFRWNCYEFSCDGRASTRTHIHLLFYFMAIIYYIFYLLSIFKHFFFVRWCVIFLYALCYIVAPNHVVHNADYLTQKYYEGRKIRRCEWNQYNKLANENKIGIRNKKTNCESIISIWFCVAEF